MRYMIMVRATEYSEAGVYPDREFVQAMTAYKMSLTAAEVLLDMQELRPSSSGIRISYSRGGERALHAGPFSLEQSLIAYYYLLEVESETEALNWALRMPIHRGCATSIDVRRIKEQSKADKSPMLDALEEDLLEQLTILREGTQ